MTEAEWLACDDVEAMVAWAVPRAHRRKAHLFAAACCRRCWHLLSWKASREAVEVGERYADRGADHWQFGKGVTGAREAAGEATRRVAGGKLTPAHVAAAQAVLAAMNAVNTWSLQSMSRAVCEALREPVGNPNHVWLLKDVFGDSFRPVDTDPAWVVWGGGTMRGMAQAAYKERNLPSGHLDPARLAVLSDALEEAGCADEAILSHLRSPGPHVRGCWALDLVLGKR